MEELDVIFQLIGDSYDFVTRRSTRAIDVVQQDQTDPP
jgi:spermidine synthase